jgi:hypothetical protein
MKRQIRLEGRKARGAALAEFGAAFVILVVFFVIPLANMSFIGVRCLIAQGAMQEFVHRLALAEKRSDSYSTLAGDSSWRNFCNNCGVQVGGTQLSLRVSDVNGSQSRWQASQKVPANLLPGGTNAPCIYTCELSVNVEIPPIYKGGGPAVPGLTTPIPFTLAARSAWENLSQDPASKEYFINE